MKEDVKNLWVAALRSGKYEQTSGALQDGDGYCCLGVLCRVAIEAGLDLPVKPPAFEYDGDDAKFGSAEESAWLPVEVMDWSGVKDSEGDFDVVTVWDDGEETQETESLSKMNDNGETFEFIADAIEKYWQLI